MAALAQLADGVIEDVRIAMGSVAPVPLRLTETERVIKSKTVNARLSSDAQERRRRGDPAD